jgi:hypothetical protein
MLAAAANLNRRRLAGPLLAVVLCLGCSSGLDNQPAPPPRSKRVQTQPRFRSPEMDAMYKAAKASPHSFDPVYSFAKAVADACLASLAFKCDACGEGAMRYKQRSELEPHYWPIIEEALSMLDVLGKTAELAAPDRVDQLIATKGRLLWLAGRSLEEQTMIDDYAKAHPDAVAVIRRRLELMREASDIAGAEAQCNLARAKTESSPEPARVDLLTACVALHPRNTNGRSDLLDYPKYLPHLTENEEDIYRKSLVDRCEAKADDEESACAEGCGCQEKEGAEPPTGKCKKACARCRSEKSQRIRLCKKITEAPSAVPRPPKPSAAPTPAVAPPKRLPPPTVGPSENAPKVKRDTGKGLKPMEL